MAVGAPARVSLGWECLRLGMERSLGHAPSGAPAGILSRRHAKGFHSTSGRFDEDTSGRVTRMSHLYVAWGSALKPRAAQMFGRLRAPRSRQARPAGSGTLLRSDRQRPHAKRVRLIEGA